MRGTGAALVLPFVNTEAMNLHLAEISKTVAPGAHGVVTLDGAGWHQTGGELKVPDNITLLPLPPYSPELNPVENIWQFLRQNHLSNRVYANYTAMSMAVRSRVNPAAVGFRAISNWARPGVLG